MPRILDMHCDTAFEMAEQKQPLRRNTLQLDLERMEEYAGYIQVFAAFVDQKTIRLSPAEHCRTILANLEEELKKNRVSLITAQKELKRVAEQGKIGAILSIEGGEALMGDLSLLEEFYRTGVRLITLTWNWKNELGDGILEATGGGLTPFGKQAVAMMEQMGILVDVSHLSERGFWDVAELAQKPFVASHSCAKALCSHPRNLTNSQIGCLIAKRGGIGINFYPEFLCESKAADIRDVVRHMEYILSLGGEDVLGLGSDFDGVSSLPENLRGAEDMKRLAKAMKDAGFDDSLTEKIFFSNFYRIWREILG